MLVRAGSVVGEGDALGLLRRRRGEAVSVRAGEGLLCWYVVSRMREADPAGLRTPRGHGARVARWRPEAVLAGGGPGRHHVVLLLLLSLSLLSLLSLLTLLLF